MKRNFLALSVIVVSCAVVPASSTAEQVRANSGAQGVELTVASSCKHSVYGDAVTFTATVTNSPANGEAAAPVGTVVFMDDKTVLGTNTCLIPGVAIFSTSRPSLGSHFISVTYDDGSNPAARRSATLKQVVSAGPLNAKSLALLPNGGVRIVFGGAPNTTYAIEATTDLSAGSWTSIGTVVSDNNGAFSITDNQASGHSTRFYRAALPE